MDIDLSPTVSPTEGGRGTKRKSDDLTNSQQKKVIQVGRRGPMLHSETFSKIKCRTLKAARSSIAPGIPLTDPLRYASSRRNLRVSLSINRSRSLRSADQPISLRRPSFNRLRTLFPIRFSHTRPSPSTWILLLRTGLPRTLKMPMATPHKSRQCRQGLVQDPLLWDTCFQRISTLPRDTSPRVS